ncbi:VWA domain-containing protein [Candidatus Woesearchaeota archaeon]|nr:VWA domain-containing protein [Candidatus Woesearchaeota archaeon]
MVSFVFSHPTYLWILLLVPFIILTHLFTLKHVRATAIKFANFDALERVAKGDFYGKPYEGLLRNKSTWFLLLRVITYSILVFAIAGTMIEYQGEAPKSNFVLVVDSSMSMLAEDITPNRIDAAKSAALDFIKSVPDQTSVGIVSFSGTPVVVREMTKDKKELENGISSIDLTLVGGTNIGDSLITASNLLRDEKTKNIILMTDGRSNIGMNVDDALAFLEKGAVVVDAIGIGTEAGGSFAGQDVISRLDEDTLKNIAGKTHGSYFRVTGNEEFGNAFREIAKTSIRTIQVDISWLLLIMALGLLSFEWVLVNTKYKTIP